MRGAQAFHRRRSARCAVAMDCFVWLIRNAERTFVVDTGFTAEVAARRKREFIRAPKEGLALLGVKADAVRDVIITHMHYDHVGTFFDFPNAVFHIQDDEMSFVTGRYMRHARFAHSFEPDDVVGMVRMLFKGRVVFHKGAEDLAPGLSLHHIGGAPQCNRCGFTRGVAQVVLASDTATTTSAEAGAASRRSSIWGTCWKLRHAVGWRTRPAHHSATTRW
jgi:ribonuclease BN (tRNA processing enzyme)